MTEDGSNFTRITDNGFGDPYNHGLRAFGITSEGLFIGTANPFYGTQVWKLTEGEKAAENTEDYSRTAPRKLFMAFIVVSVIAAAIYCMKRGT